MRTQHRVVLLGSIVLFAAGIYLLSPLSPLPPLFPSLRERFRPAPSDTTGIEIPSSVSVPEPNEKLSDSSIGVPTSARDSIPGSSEKIRIFSIEGKKGGFSVQKIIVYKGDTVHIDFSARDAAYDVTFPDLAISQYAQQGERKILEFQAAQPGTFLFTCTSCGQNPEKQSPFSSSVQSKGILLVVEKSSSVSTQPLP